MKRKLISILVLFVFAFATFSFVLLQDQTTNNKKEIPAEFEKMTNPYKDDASLKMVGLRNFNRHCVSCHGKKGIGDGVMAKNLKSHPGNLSTAEFQKYNDGEIYYLSFVGINDRPDFMKLIPSDEERWAVVNYVRTLLVE